MKILVCLVSQLGMTVAHAASRLRRGRGGGVEEEEEEEEESLFKADAVNEEDSERDRATQV